ncbi:hypothetical protein GJ744_009225 [Endocarpon pusillum]|uniref:Carrier domain-containing protein n=1 Tax=Endocarpon pusillum TaxID=364733 RepID=A0A8H7E3Z1_9EURO|nr:hypothetical protein GJ744_009225 [Endocarpon pusillum]
MNHSNFNEQEELRNVLSRLVSQVSGFKEEDLDFTSPLEALGIDSLMEIELASKLRDEYPSHAVDHSRLAECETLLDIEQILMPLLDLSAKEVQSTDGSTKFVDISSEATLSSQYSHSNLAEDTQSVPVTLHVSENDETPLCLFHDGTGLVQMYRKLRGFDRSTYAFHDPHFVESAPAVSTLEQMAACYTLKLA